MNCPTPIAAILLEILSRGILRIRACSGDANRCLVEADHIHNLPNLLRDYSPQLLAFYWEVERASFVSQTPDSLLEGFESLWSELRPHVEWVGKPFSTA
jgi:hypothetical protein